MKADQFAALLGGEFYTGVPDSQLRALCDYLMDTYGTDPRHHVIGANEGNCAALAAGYHLATGRIPVVYMQNSGEGNIVNPAASLLHEKVYGIPVLFVIGWRGEPGVHDEPQHIWQGEITLRLLEDLEIPSFVVGPDTSPAELEQAMVPLRASLAQGRSAALVVRKGALTYDKKVVYRSPWTMTREEVIRRVLAVSGEDPIVSTTGKASRELFELRAGAGQGHQYDLLTVGSMGHSSSIALGVALQKPDTKVWCIDGDGAVLMHMGAMAVIGSVQPRNLIHVVVNNGAHETVGGMPTAARSMDLPAAARACGYPFAFRAEDYATLDRLLQEARDREGLTLLEARCAIGSRGDLGRPTTSAAENRQGFSRFLQGLPMAEGK